MRFDFLATAKEAYSIILKDLGAYGGFPFYGIVILTALLLKSFYFAYTLILSVIAVTLAVSLIRLLYFKPRPGQKKQKYDDLYKRVDNSSFPSIHMARAVMLSIAFYEGSPVFMPLLLLLTIIVALSRLYFNRHDMTDIIAGTVLGIALGWFFFV